MSHLVVPIDADYLEYEEEESHPWKWLEICVSYLPMYTPLKRNNKGERNKFYSLFMIIICVILNFVVLITSPVYKIVGDPSMLGANQLFSGVVTYISKLFQLHYFFTAFNYPWNKVDKDEDTDKKGYPTFNNKQYMSYYSIFTLISIVILIVVDLFWIVGLYLEDADEIQFLLSLYRDGDYDKVKISLYLAVYLIFYEYPLVVTFAVHSAICIKYRMYFNRFIKQIDRNMNCSSADKKDTKDFLKNLTIKYRKFYEEFNSEYPWSIRSAIQFYLLREIFELWIDTYDLDIDWSNHGLRFMSISAIIWKLGIMIIYTAPASLVSEQCVLFQSKLYEYCNDKYLNELDDNTDIMKHGDSYCLHYAKEHRIRFAIGKLVITKKNVFRFVCIFILARYISFTVTYLGA